MNRLNLKYHEDVIDNFGHANINKFAKGFDVGEFLDEFDELNVCELCGDICNTWEELYWQGEQDIETNEILDDCTAVCDDCFHKLSEKFK